MMFATVWASHFPGPPENVADLCCGPCPAARRGDPARVEGGGNLAKARAVGLQRQDERQDIGGELLGGGLCLGRSLA